jgi:hypothetical protein
MKFDDFLNYLGGSIDGEQGRLGQSGNGAEAFYSAAVASYFFGVLKDKDIGLMDFEPCSFSHGAGTKKGEAAIQGYYLEADFTQLHLFCVVPVAKLGEKLTAGQVNSQVDKAVRFLRLAENGHHRELEPAFETHGSMKAIFDAGDKIETVRVFVFTTGVCPKFERKIETERGQRIETSFYDADRLHKVVQSGQAREPIVIEFKHLKSGPLSVIHVEEPKGGYDSYLGVIDGETIAQMYGRYSSRLIEQNVRMYLQARGKVNAGIQETIRDNPGKFLAYNNGLSLTASSVACTKPDKNGICMISSINDLQIVNGAQTTGSIYHAKKREGKEVGGLRIQFKLTVPRKGADVPQLVADISKYSNSQNAVKVTDLKANQPYHINIEAKSRTIFTTITAENATQTRWFYERARGAYLVEKVNNPGKTWQRQNPENQMFTKVDLGKSEVTYWGEPHIVSRGGEKNFVYFMGLIEKATPIIDDNAFKHIVARLIMFRTAESVVQSLKQGGYRANVVAYSLAYIYQRTEDKLNLDSIWLAQGLSDQLKSVIAKVAAAAFEHISKPPHNVANVGEWAKKPECWASFAKAGLPMDLGSCPEMGLGPSAAAKSKKEPLSELSGDYTRRETWESLLSWSKQNKAFGRKDMAFIAELAEGEAYFEILEGKKLNWATDLAAKAEGMGFRPQS